MEAIAELTAAGLPQSPTSTSDDDTLHVPLLPSPALPAYSALVHAIFSVGLHAANEVLPIVDVRAKLLFQYKQVSTLSEATAVYVSINDKQKGFNGQLMGTDGNQLERQATKSPSGPSSHCLDAIAPLESSYGCQLSNRRLRSHLPPYLSCRFLYSYYRFGGRIPCHLTCRTIADSMQFCD
jgi:hypothetical protein